MNEIKKYQVNNSVKSGYWKKPSMVVSTTTVGGFVMSREIRHKASTKMCLPGEDDSLK